MGIGDILMSMGEAKRIHARLKKPVMIIDRSGRPLESDLTNGVKYIVKTGAAERHLNCGGHRPYILGKTPQKWTWKPYKPMPADIRFSAEELAFAEPHRGMLMIEPNVKAIGHWNKAWPATRWLELSERLKHPMVQCISDAGAQCLPNALKVITPTFRHAAAVLSVAKAFVSAEGGLMHAAAAVGTPAVILWSEFISPDVTGYSTMTNLRMAGKACGSRRECEGCRRSMEAITVDDVLNALEPLL